MKHLLGELGKLGLEDKKLTLILDFDGTLTPVRRDFRKVRLSRDMLAILKKLTLIDSLEVIVLTGRTIDFIKSRIPINGIELIAERGVFFDERFLLDKTESDAGLAKIRRILEPIKLKYTARIEEKKASLVFHVRNVRADKRGDAVKDALIKTRKVISDSGVLKTLIGRMTVEFLPKRLPDKGDTARKIIKERSVKRFYIYVGDDTSDEPAFREVNKKGFGILVRSREKEFKNTQAIYYLKGVGEVKKFMKVLTKQITDTRSRKT